MSLRLLARYGLSRLSRPWSPADLANLALWLDASDPATITESSGAVSQWTSKDANGRTFTQATGALQPTTGSVTLNSLNTVAFAGDYLTTTAAKSVWNFLHGSAKHTILAVAKFGVTSDPNAIYGFMGTQGAEAQRGVTHLWDDRVSVPRNQRWLSLVRPASGPVQTLSFVTDDDAVTANTWHQLTLKADYANSTALERLHLHVDGGSAIKKNILTDAPSASDSHYDLQIGAGGNNWSPLTGGIAELLIYSRELTGGERSQAEAYLTGKWGL